MYRSISRIHFFLLPFLAILITTCAPVHEVSEYISGDISPLKPDLRSQEVKALFLPLQPLQDGPYGYLLTSYGVEIHKDCYGTPWGAELERILASSLRQGLICLSKQGSPSCEAMARKIVALLADRKNPVKLHCLKSNVEDLSTLHGSMAMATHPQSAGYPGVTISYGLSGFQEEFLKEALFHEFMHLVTHAHGQGIEFAYTCEACCFWNTSWAIRKQACEFCQGKYQDPKIPEYNRAIVEWAFAAGLSQLARFEMIRIVIREEDYSRESLFLFLKAFSSTPLAYALARRYQEFFPSLTPAEMQLISRIRAGEGRTGFKEYKARNDAIANLLFAFVQGDIDLANEWRHFLVQASAQRDLPNCSRAEVNYTIQFCTLFEEMLASLKRKSNASQPFPAE